MSSKCTSDSVCSYFSRDLGVQIDGFIALAAHTIVVRAPVKDAAPVDGRKADAILAAHNALQAALRLMRPGNLNTTVTEHI